MKGLYLGGVFMKRKIYTGMIAFCMAGMLVGCGKEKEEDLSGSMSSLADSQQTSVVQPSNSNTSLTDQVDQYVASTQNTTSEAVDATTESQQTTVTIDAAGSFEAKDDLVYATTNVTVRNAPSVEADPVMTLVQGDSIHRVGYDASWTKVEANGYYYYIATQFLTTNPDAIKAE